MTLKETNINRRIVDLRWEIDDCKECRNWKRAKELREEIDRLEMVLRIQNNIEE